VDVREKGDEPFWGGRLQREQDAVVAQAAMPSMEPMIGEVTPRIDKVPASADH
jgi:hypothetical protein